jgi:hypothetical protein
MTIILQSYVKHLLTLKVLSLKVTTSFGPYGHHHQVFDCVVFCYMVHCRLVLHSITTVMLNTRKIKYVVLTEK